MIALWMVYATCVAALASIGAAVVERASGGRLHQRRWAWVLALALSMGLPLWSLSRGREATDTGASPSGLSSPTAAFASEEIASRLAAIVQSAAPRSLGTLDTVLVIAWSIAAAVALISYVVATLILARRRRSWRRATVDGQPVLLSTAIGPAVIGALRPEIVVPEWSLELAAEQRTLMLEHERQHVRARDPLLLHAAALSVAIMPWNVALWWTNRRLRLAVELDCDARVLSNGRDPRSYGTLLLDVCSRRARSGPLLAPALLERTSSLAKRILAMQPERSRFPRTRVALGVAAAAVVVALACGLPTPAMLAPDGPNAGATRLYGSVAPARDARADEPRALVARYFPSVARGEGGAAVLFVVRSSTGTVVRVAHEPAGLAGGPSNRVAASAAGRPPGSASAVRVEVPTRRQPERRVATARVRTSAVLPEATKPREAGAGLPAGIRALDPDDIANVDITKHGAGSIAPKPVSIITIVLKPGARVPAVGAAR